MADATTNPDTTGTNLQGSNAPQANDNSGLQPQSDAGLPTTTPTTQLQQGANGLNAIRSSKALTVTGAPATSSSKRPSGTVLSIILVAVILIIAAALFIASFRVSDDKKDSKKKKVDDARPTVAVGPEISGALGTTKKLSKRKLKKLKKSKK